MIENILEAKLKDYLDKKLSLEEFFNSLPEDTKRIYEIYVAKLVASKEITINRLKEIIKSNELSHKVRYSAFFALCTMYRRNKEYTLYGQILREYYELFKDFSSYYHLKAMYLVEVVQNEEDMRYAIEVADGAIISAPDNTGFLHSYAITVANAFEQSYMSIKNNSDKELLDKALMYVNKAIDLEPDYAKFYSTRGRLKGINSLYKEAKAEINKALDMEDSSKDGYGIRIGDYQKHLLNINFKENVDSISKTFNSYENKIEELEKQVCKAYDELESSKTRNLEFLGFFAALISFTIGSVQILSNQSFMDAARLILILGGSLLLVLGGFGIILNGNKELKRSVIVWVLGILIITISLLSIKVI